MEIVQWVAVGVLILVAMCLVFPYVARIVGSKLLAHADGVDAYHERKRERRVYWLEKATERPALIQISRRAAGE